MIRARLAWALQGIEKQESSGSAQVLRLGLGWCFSPTVGDGAMAGRIRQPRPAGRFDRPPAAFTRHVPVPGEHTRQILAEFGPLLQ